MPAQTTTQIQDVRDLLADAKHVANYGVRAGSFGQNEPLLAAIEKAEAKTDLAWSSPEATALQQALSAAIRTIRPVTLYDLKAGWRVDADTPTSWPRKVKDSVVKWFVVAATAYALLVCAAYTAWQQRAASLVAEMSSDKLGLQAQAFESLFALIGPVGEDGAAFDRANAAKLLPTFRQKLREVEAIERAMLADRLTFHHLMERRPLSAGDPVYRATLGILAWTATPFRDAGEPGAAAAAPLEQEEVAAAPRESAIPIRAVAGPNGEIIPQGEASAAPQDACNDIFIQFDLYKNYAFLNNAQVNAVRYFLSSLGYDSAFVRKIRCHLNILGGSQALAETVDLEELQTLDQMKSQLALVNLWSLPALYGMLGALIYHLRAFLSNLRPNPTLTKVVIRVGLGGFAGIAIGWFWMPEETSVLGITEITITPLTIAFLVGFSIDTFVAFLDRIVTLVNRWIGNLGAPA